MPLCDVAIPTLVVTTSGRGERSMSNGSRMISSKRAATRWGPAADGPPSTNTTNSSPPMRPIVSTSRRPLVSRAATDRSN